jgi:hypothetical protein
MNGTAIVFLVILTILLCFLGYLTITQRSEDNRTTTRVMDQAETLVRLVVTSSNSQSADMTDLAARQVEKITEAVTTIAKSQADFLELVTLGRELPPQTQYEMENEEREKRELDPYENMPWPSNIAEALRTEAEIAEQMKNPPYMPNFPRPLKQPESTSEMNGSSEVSIEPI